MQSCRVSGPPSPAVVRGSGFVWYFVFPPPPSPTYEKKGPGLEKLPQVKLEVHQAERFLRSHFVLEEQ